MNRRRRLAVGKKVKPKQSSECRPVGTVKGTKLWAGNCVAPEPMGRQWQDQNQSQKPRARSEKVRTRLRCCCDRNLACHQILVLITACHARPQKITFAEMRESGVCALFVYCADYRCGLSIAISGDSGPMMSGCPISSLDSLARPAASAVRT